MYSLTKPAPTNSDCSYVVTPVVLFIDRGQYFDDVFEETVFVSHKGVY